MHPSFNLFALRLWLITGALTLIVFPEARGHHALIGWLPLWLVLAPLASLAVWRILAGHDSELRRRRLPRRRLPVQARRLRRVRHSRVAHSA